MTQRLTYYPQAASIGREPCRLHFGLYSCDPRRLRGLSIGCSANLKHPSTSLLITRPSHQVKESDTKANIILILFGACAHKVGYFAISIRWGNQGQRRGIMAVLFFISRIFHISSERRIPFSIQRYSVFFSGGRTKFFLPRL